MDLAGLEQRLSRLEDDRAIRDLKARYLRACDTKDVETLRDALLPEGAVIAYDGFPPFDGRDAFVEVYRAMGCAPGTVKSLTSQALAALRQTAGLVDHSPLHAALEEPSHA